MRERKERNEDSTGKHNARQRPTTTVALPQYPQRSPGSNRKNIHAKLGGTCAVCDTTNKSRLNS